jgi:hypothetical protein
MALLVPKVVMIIKFYCGVKPKFNNAESKLGIISSSSSLSSGTTTSDIETLGLLNYLFPFVSIQDAGLPCGLVDVRFHSYTFLTILSLSIW